MSKLRARNVSILYGGRRILEPTDIELDEGRVCALIGPQSASKTAFLRAFNRLSAEQAGMQVFGEIFLDGKNIDEMDRLTLTKRIGMIFPEPAPFAGTIEENVTYGLRIRGEKKLSVLRNATEMALREVDLWAFRDHLRKNARSLSIEQQQRLCIARALALSPEVLLMDEPFSKIDTGSRLHIEEIIQGMKERYTVILAVSNIEQAGRVSTDAAFLLDGAILEYGPTEEIFYRPKQPQTKNYITGRLT